MKAIEWTDEDGYRRRRLIRDKDPVSARETGIPREPPDLKQLDWPVIKKDLHNALFNRDLLTWKDVQRSQNGVTSAILSVLRRRVIMLYRTKGG